MDGGGGTELRCDTLLNERGLPEKSEGSLLKIFEQSWLTRGASGISEGAEAARPRQPGWVSGSSVKFS